MSRQTDNTAHTLFTVCVVMLTVTLLITIGIAIAAAWSSGLRVAVAVIALPVMSGLIVWMAKQPEVPGRPAHRHDVMSQHPPTPPHTYTPGPRKQTHA